MRLAVGAVALAAIGLTAATDKPIAYPDGFRTWTHIASAVAGPSAAKYEGVHHIYANPKAMAGYRTGRWADGAVIVFDQWTAIKPGPDSVAAGERKFSDVMVRDSRRFAATGGWGYAEFAGAQRTRVPEIEQKPQGCDGCHQNNAPGGDRIFSVWRE